MSNLLLELQGNKSLNRTVWPPRLYVFDDLLIYKRRHWFRVKEITISYSQISQVELNKGIIFGGLEIITTGPDKIVVNYVIKSKATQAKRIIDQKIFHAHAKHKPDEGNNRDELANYEKSLARLKELYQKEKLTKKEFEQKKKELLKDLR